MNRLIVCLLLLLLPSMALARDATKAWVKHVSNDMIVMPLPDGVTIQQVRNRLNGRAQTAGYTARGAWTSAAGVATRKWYKDDSGMRHFLVAKVHVASRRFRILTSKRTISPGAPPPPAWP